MTHLRVSKLSSLDRRGIYNIVLCIGIVVALSALAILLRPPAFDEESLCIKGAMPAHRFVVIDKTDPYTKAQTRAIEKLIKREISDLSKGDKITLGILDRDGFTPLYSLCNPGTGDDESSVYRNPAKIRERYRRRFESPLDGIIPKLIQPGWSEFSPILEKVVVSLPQEHDFSAEVPRRRLVLVSDMLQHSTRYSVYNGGALPDAKDVAAQLMRSYGDVWRGLEIEIWLIQRDGREERQAEEGDVRLFWTNLLRSLGATPKWRML